jgi:hypothetical protein
MQKPFTLTEDMAREIDEQIANTSPGKVVTDDAAGTLSGRVGIPRRKISSGDSPRTLSETFNHPRELAEEVADPKPPEPTVEDILEERGKTHGDFTDNSRVIQSLKRIMHTEVGWDKLTDTQREAIHMILHKLGRIISGNPNVKDHWDDIAGYARLVSERVVEGKR